jgi:hypothetical protein
MSDMLSLLAETTKTRADVSRATQNLMRSYQVQNSWLRRVDDADGAEDGPRTSVSMSASPSKRSGRFGPQIDRQAAKIFHAMECRVVSIMLVRRIDRRPADDNQVVAVDHRRGIHE